MKAFLSCLATALALLSLTRPVQAQFPHYNQDHWAYQAMTDLEKAGIMIGYPDGLFHGNRAMPREDFAIAIRRVLQIVPVKPTLAGNQGPDASHWTDAQIQAWLFSTLPEIKEGVKTRQPTPTMPRRGSNPGHSKAYKQKRKGHEKR